MGLSRLRTYSLGMQDTDAASWESRGDVGVKVFKNRACSDGGIGWVGGGEASAGSWRD
jgi:hypothetical protein